MPPARHRPFGEHATRRCELLPAGASLDHRGWTLGPHLLGDRVQILLERVRPLAGVALAHRLPTLAQSQDSAFLPVAVGRTHRVHSAGYGTPQTR